MTLPFHPQIMSITNTAKSSGFATHRLKSTRPQVTDLHPEVCGCSWVLRYSSTEAVHTQLTGSSQLYSQSTPSSLNIRNHTNLLKWSLLLPSCSQVIKIVTHKKKTIHQNTHTSEPWLEAHTPRPQCPHFHHPALLPPHQPAGLSSPQSC